MKAFPGTLEQQRTYVYAVLFLFFIQSVTDFIEAVYVFGLLGTGIPNEIISILFFLAPLVVLVTGRRLAGAGLVLVAEMALISRLVASLLDTRGRMLVSGFGVACALIFLPLLLWRLSRVKKRPSHRELGIALTLALGLAVLLRAWDSGSDLSMQGWGQLIGWALAIPAGVLLPWIFRDGKQAQAADQSRRAPSFGRLAGLSAGMLAVFILLHFALSSPNVVARWTGADYLTILAALALAMSLFSVLSAVYPGWLESMRKSTLLLWNLLFVAALMLTILPHQLDFPALRSGYPLYEPPVSVFSSIPLYLMLLLSPIVLVNFMFYTRELISLELGPRQLGGGMLIASVFYLIMVLAHVFTTVYAYIPLIGPAFRDQFWLVYLLAGIVMALPVLLVRQPSGAERPLRKPGIAVLPSVIFTAALIGGILVSARPAPPVAPANSLRLLTYNIQQGYDPQGLINFEGQLALIRGADPDIIALQESDTNRIAGGNADVVRYFADRLEMHSYYGPKTTTGTFGIALLSKYPIESPRTFFMYSEREQTATITAQVTAGGQVFNLFITHLGNGGPIEQQKDFMEEVEGLERVIAMGDFNFRPGSEQYQLTVSSLADAWLQRWSSGVDDQGYNPSRRIDHFFVSPTLQVSEASYLTQPESDHPAVLLEITW